MWASRGHYQCCARTILDNIRSSAPMPPPSASHRGIKVGTGLAAIRQGALNSYARHAAQALSRHISFIRQRAHCWVRIASLLITQHSSACSFCATPLQIIIWMTISLTIIASHSVNGASQPHKTGEHEGRAAEAGLTDAEPVLLLLRLADRISFILARAGISSRHDTAMHGR